jgi:nucleoside-diphosphate kinase
VVEQTLSIIKPDGTERHLIGKIVSKFEAAGLSVVAMRRQTLSQKEAEGFYAVHKARPFFGELVQMMTSGPVVLMVLRGENAIARNREIMGATDPSKAASGTIRKEFAKSIGENTVHGSDSPENAQIEIQYFFRQTEIG